MIERSIFLGIDTSNYTTSAAIVSDEGIIANLKIPLRVKPGERGVRQSDAVFMHTVNLPVIMEKLSPYIADDPITAIGVSDKPRNPEGSYMPCFLAGVSSAVAMTVPTGLPLFRFSHQCGHIMAAICSSGAYDLLEKRFAAFHVSGGTTELVSVAKGENGFDTEIIGGTLDLNAGQLIDRIGVLMGLDFPAGPALERLALENIRKIPKRKVSSKGTYVNISGIENMAVRLYSETSDKSLTSAFVLERVSDALRIMCDSCAKEHGINEFLFAGGVMSNEIIKSRLSAGPYKVHFAEPALSADNAVGIAELAKMAYYNEKR